MDDTISPRELGDLLKVQASTVIGWIERGRLTAGRRGRLWKITLDDARTFCVNHGLRREFEERYGSASQ